ncbi:MULTISPECIES: hypothetical protein [unclassified Pseudomonas]|uniref:hypothetical protein n=2 Tax=Pseudomonas TaxID=286 RepID=UPI002AC8E5EA|nr:MULTISPECIES: hypothetical protein [unclassified Pseudomonas]MEB0041673.1 hypothetical protein [Pseudomonas sp. MH10]MEB0093338.1 hypothetical protein [Pseudomonas sp. CCI4.2]MEB0100972.1 hypothetical protein [Pseudomonas sp. CCI3.2]MEB0121951.1 hypothetical protein [Pseudomonas sp. CCI1.2]MEB0130547.1 hypothetical protein [Pseudomonas sp. CCI2.4]
MPTSYINAGSMMFFDDPVKDADKRDILDASLYTQLAASKKHPKFAEFDAWYTTYLKAMATFGWIVSERGYCSEPIQGPGPFDLWLLIEAELEGRVPVSLIQTAERIAVHSPEHVFNPAAQSLLGEHALRSDRPEGGDLLSSVVLQLSFVHGAPSMTSIFIAFKTRAKVAEHALLKPFDRNQIVGNVELASFSAQLSDLRYSQFRDTFISALGARRSSLILALEASQQ